MKKCLFIDRDGTMGASADVEFPDTFVPFPYVKQCVELAHSAGWTVCGFTNQSCFARGKDRGHDFEAEFSGYGFDALFLCPHDNATGCDCRKPKPGLLFRAREEIGADLENSIVIGDRDSALAAGAAAGCKTVLVRTGRKKTPEDEKNFQKYNLLFVADDLLEAVERIAGGKL